MTSFHQESYFTQIQMAPLDPILGITEAFNLDQNPKKINLGVGVYYNADGQVPLLECVRKAECELVSHKTSRVYLPINGLSTYNDAVQELIFGTNHSVVQDRRIITVQALGGTGALKLGADFIKQFIPISKQIWISDPSWENHQALFEMAGFIVKYYPYYDVIKHNVDFNAMCDALNIAPSGSIILLHACCHNPTGADLDSEQWTQIISIMTSRGLIPFLDMAYQGFRNGLIEDSSIISRFIEMNSVLFVANSFSKSLALYGERVGALSIVTSSHDVALRVLSQLKRVVRTNYSNPPIYGSQIVSIILKSPTLRTLWEQELNTMRLRIREMRKLLVQKLKEKTSYDFGFVMRQHGMFSYSGLTKKQIARLRHEYSIYAIQTGRICIAALNYKNIDTIVNAIAQVLSSEVKKF